MMRLSSAVVAQMVASTPSRSNVGWLNGLLTRATTLGTPNFSLATCEMMMLSSSSPVTATTMSQRPMPAFSSTQTSVPSPNTSASSPSSSAMMLKRVERCSTSTISWPRRMSWRAVLRPTLPPPTMSTNMAQPSAMGS